MNHRKIKRIRLGPTASLRNKSEKLPTIKRHGTKLKKENIT